MLNVACLIRVRGKKKTTGPLTEKVRYANLMVNDERCKIQRAPSQVLDNFLPNCFTNIST